MLSQQQKITMSCDKTVLSYHDSLLRESDVALLDGSNWLNDKIIGFYFEYLEYDKYSEHSEQVSFITPDVAQFIKLYEGPELGIFLDPLNIHQKELVVLAINNNTSAAQAGGSHWSTLVYVRKENAFYHLDSLASSNTSPAKQCAQKITQFLQVTTKPVFNDVKCPQQENFHDCGVYALCFAQAMCAIKLQGSNEQSTLFKIDGEYVQTWRKDVKTLIDTLQTKN